MEPVPTVKRPFVLPQSALCDSILINYAVLGLSRLSWPSDTRRLKALGPASAEQELSQSLGSYLYLETGGRLFFLTLHCLSRGSGGGCAEDSSSNHSTASVDPHWLTVDHSH